MAKKKTNNGNMGTPGQDVWFHVLKCRPVKFQSDNNHFQVLVNAANKQFWFTANVRFVPKAGQESDNVFYHVEENFKHPITQKIKEANLDWGFTEIPERPGGIALDYIKGNLVKLEDFKLLQNAGITHTDLSELLASYINRVRNSDDAVMYVFGSKFPLPNDNRKGSNPFSLNPNIGMHDIHMNQGSGGGHAKSNAPWQDGAIFIYFPKTDTWSAIFLAFETQINNLIGKVPDGGGTQPDDNGNTFGESNVKIIAAMVNPSGDERANEFIYLLNVSKSAVALNNWELEDTSRQKQKLTENIAPYQLLKVAVPDLELSNKGGTISLYDGKGAKIHGVSYTKKDASVEDKLVVFG